MLVPPFPALAQAARGIGHARVAYDLDGPWRRYIPFVAVDDHVVPSLPLAAALTARGLAPAQVSASRAALQLGDARVPWIEQVVPDYYGPSQTVWRPLVPFRGPTMRADHTPVVHQLFLPGHLPGRAAIARRRDAAPRPGACSRIRSWWWA